MRRARTGTGKDGASGVGGAALAALAVVFMAAGAWSVAGAQATGGRPDGARGEGPALAGAAAETRVSEASASASVTSGRFGLAHVDLMDLHVVRESGVPVDREILPSSVIEERYARAAESGAAWNRWSLYWDLVERTPGAHAWGPVDAMVARDRRYALRTIAILQGVPPFRSGAPSVAAGDRAVDALAGRRGGGGIRYGTRSKDVPSAPPPAALDAPIFLDAGGAGTDDPARAARVNPGNPWAVFVDTAVERYRPGGELARREGWPEGAGVDVWEIGNEPNLEHFWSGTLAQYVRYLEVAYLVIERRSPEATVLHGGIADHPSAFPWFGAFLDALNAAAARSPLPGRHGHYLDAVVWHWYAYADRLRTGPADVRAALAARGFAPRPLWVTEMGVPIWSEHPGPCWDSRSPWRATLDEQAAYVLQATSEGAAADLAALVHFQAYDDCGNGPSSYDAFGLLRNHRENQCWDPPGHACWTVPEAALGSPRPAYHAFRLAADALDGATRLWRPAPDAGGWQRILFYRPPDERVSVIWSLRREPVTAEFFVTGPSARIHAPSGGEIVAFEATPAAGRLRVDLPPMTNRNDPGSGAALMGGHPIVVVERDTAAPFRAELAPLPETSPLELTLVARAADGGTGVGRVRLLVADRLPEGAGDWRAAGDDLDWAADPLSGEMPLSFTGTPGATAYFALVAADRAGNWTAPPAGAHAWTTFEPGAPTGEVPSPSPSALASATPSPSAAAPETTPPPASATATPTPTPSPSSPPPPPPTHTTPAAGLPHRIFLPTARVR